MLFKNEQGEQVLTLEDMICHFEDGGSVVSVCGKILNYVGKKPRHTDHGNLVFQDDKGQIWSANDNLYIHGHGGIVGVAPEKKLTSSEILDLMKQGRIGKTRDGSKVKLGYVSMSQNIYTVLCDFIDVDGVGIDDGAWTRSLEYNIGIDNELDIIGVFPEGTEFK